MGDQISHLLFEELLTLDGPEGRVSEVQANVKWCWKRLKKSA